MEDSPQEEIEYVFLRRIKKFPSTISEMGTSTNMAVGTNSNIAQYTDYFTYTSSSLPLIRLLYTELFNLYTFYVGIMGTQSSVEQVDYT